MKRLLLPLALLTTILTPLATQAQQKTTAATPSAVERDLRTFSAWVDQKIDSASAGAHRKWPKLMADYDRQSARLDRAVDSLSVQSKQKYVAQKARYKAWSAEQQQLEASVQSDPAKATAIQNKLLGENVTISKTRAAELPDLYGRFLESTRAQRRSWTATDWTAAGVVLAKLNGRYDQVRDQLDIDEKVRIRSLQGEFRTLEKAKDVKDIFNGL
ncbi:DUF6565 domain-containing protein [Hymenobacter crusticola]|uniref:DUF6565 domain-containing protein n=1 Tax=Hymenobacter crusticola TaxID=1770526 RepID=A0A243WAY7_9BACT|nr:DUF6565 domain-containing protein [Hymenobacter crusticola]OUJ72540.1 hypothetical protein BXP70_18470 [Hymenobacter crusticola]